MNLSVIIPAFNEEKTIGNVLTALISIEDITQIVVVNDASTDQTESKVKSVHNKKITLINQSRNAGKGAAIRSGLDALTGDYVLIQDADLEYDPRDIPNLLEPIKNGKVSVVYGSRFIGARTNMFYWHYLGNLFLNFIINILFNSILSDMETGYKVMPTKLMKELDLQSNDFRIEPEITCKLLKRKEKIMEVPITYIGRTYEEGKKITWVDGFKALDTIFTLRFTL